MDISLRHSRTFELATLIILYGYIFKHFDEEIYDTLSFF